MCFSRIPSVFLSRLKHVLPSLLYVFSFLHIIPHVFGAANQPAHRTLSMSSVIHLLVHSMLLCPSSPPSNSHLLSLLLLQLPSACSDCALNLFVVTTQLGPHFWIHSEHCSQCVLHHQSHKHHTEFASEQYPCVFLHWGRRATF